MAMTYAERFLEQFRVFRSKHFGWVGRFFLRYKFHANFMTCVSLLCGTLSAYFLFSNNFLFAIFGLSHLLADGIDGIIARESSVSTYGKYFDAITDSTVNFLLLLKIGWFIGDYFVFIIAGLYFIVQSIHFISGMKVPVLYSRTGTVLLLVLYPWIAIIPVVTYLFCGAVAMYSFARQVQYFGAMLLRNK